MTQMDGAENERRARLDRYSSDPDDLALVICHECGWRSGPHYRSKGQALVAFHNWQNHSSPPNKRQRRLMEEHLYEWTARPLT